MLQNQNNKLGRKYFLKHKTEIQNLFEKGIRFNKVLVRSIYLSKENEDNYGIKIFVSVPKKKINKACNRNLVKRRIKEAIRLNLSELKQLSADKKIEIYIGFVYCSNKIENYNIIENKIVLSLQNIYSNLLDV
ncbi:MAG: ribonuclease P protein component [Bacteroidales bacterium]|nr:ribonuclease P protein component [Bacteroidales bacterium]